MFKYTFVIYIRQILAASKTILISLDNFEVFSEYYKRTTSNALVAKYCKVSKIAICQQ